MLVFGFNVSRRLIERNTEVAHQADKTINRRKVERMSIAIHFRSRTPPDQSGWSIHSRYYFFPAYCPNLIHYLTLQPDYIFPRHFNEPFTFFFGFEVTIITLNEYSRRVNVAENLMNSLAFFIRNDHHDAIAETPSLSFIYSIFIGSLFSLACFGNDFRKILKNRELFFTSSILYKILSAHLFVCLTPDLYEHTYRQLLCRHTCKEMKMIQRWKKGRTMTQLESPKEEEGKEQSSFFHNRIKKERMGSAQLLLQRLLYKNAAKEKYSNELWVYLDSISYLISKQHLPRRTKKLQKIR